jgi:PAS domain S-box-containing protein
MIKEDLFAKKVLKIGLLDADSQREETTQFLGLIQRLAELSPGDSGVRQTCINLVQIIIEETNFDNCSIVLWDAEKSRLSLAAAFGLEDLLAGKHPHPCQKDLSFEPGEGIAGQVFRNRQPMFFETVKDLVPVKADAVVQPVSLVCLPLLDLGVLNLSSRQSLKFTAQQRRNWTLLGRIAGFLIQEAFSQGSAEPASSAGAERSAKDTTASERDRFQLSSVAYLSEQAIDRTPQGICLLSLEGDVVRINKGLERLHGENVSQIVGRSPAVLFHDPKVFVAALARAAASNQEEMADISLVNSEGQIFSADVSLVKLPDDGHGTGGYLLVIDDMTKKKASAKKVLQTEKLAALGTMAGGVAHDFNNLLMSILGNVQLILPMIQDEDVRRRLANVEKAVHEGAETVRRLQKFTKREREVDVASTIKVDVSEVVSEIVDLTRPHWKNEMEKHGHSIEFKLGLEANCFAAMQPSDFREVMMNLVFNAIQAMPEGGTIGISSKTEDDSVLVEVSDTGIGMSEEVAARIFDPFYTTKGISNSGLGLSVTWSLVGRSGGEIQVKSKPGKGSVFLVRLPKPAQGNMRAVSTLKIGRKGPYRILLIDENSEVLRTLRDMLRLKGHRVMAVYDGAKALDLAAQEEFDIVFADQGMRAISGWDIAKMVKQKDSRIPVVLLSGWGLEDEGEDLAARGVDLVLSKPLRLESLLDALETLLRPSATAQQDSG